MAKSIHDLVHGLDVGNSIEEVIEATEEAAGRLSDTDDRMREMISVSDDFSVNFGDKTVQELKDHISNVNQQLQDLLTEIY